MPNPKTSRPRVLLINRAIVFDENKNFLLIQRAADETWSPNLWEFPGGKLDVGQDVAHALEREVFEETGLVVMPINRVVYYESNIVSTGKYKGLVCVVLIGLAKAVGGNTTLSVEHQNYKWCQIDEKLDLALTEETSKALVVLQQMITNLQFR